MSTSVGPTYPGTGTNSNAVGTIAWNNPGNIVSDNASYAIAPKTSGSAVTNYLRASNFGFTIPSGSNIYGIVVEIKRARTGTSGSVIDSRVSIVKSDGSVGTTNKASGSNWPTSQTYATYGTSSDLWDETWAYTDINDTDFGVVLSATVTDSFDGYQADVDTVRITVTYGTQYPLSGGQGTFTVTGYAAVITNDEKTRWTNQTKVGSITPTNVVKN